MHPWLHRFLQGFSFQVNYPVLRYIAICAFSLAGALLGAFISGGEAAWIVLLGGGFYLAGRLVVWILYR